MKYNAILIPPNAQNPRSAGVLVLNNEMLQFISDNQEFTLPISSLTITSGGANNQLIFIHSPQLEGQLYTTDILFLSHPIWENYPQIKASFKRVIQVKNNYKKGVVFVALTLLFLCIALFFSKEYFVKKIARSIPSSWEKKSGDQLFKVLKGQYLFIENDTIQQKFKPVIQPFIRFAKSKNIQLEFYFITDKSINAFALPGGKIVINSGLIQSAHSWEELMGVLAHEVSHLTEKHHVRGIINEVGLFTLLSVLVGDVSALAGTIASTGGNLASLSNSRAYESEADEKGVELLQHCSINPTGLLQFFKTLEKQESDFAKADWMSFLTTHPGTKDRIQHIKNYLLNHPSKSKPISSDWKSFQQLFN